MTESAIFDRLALHELHEAYSDAVLRADAQAWGECWAEDAVWTMMGTTVTGRPAIVSMWTQAMAGFEAVSLIAVPTMIAIDGDSATGRTQTQEVLRQSDGRTRVVGGVYDDRFVRGDAGWLYAARDFRIVAEHPAEEER